MPELEVIEKSEGKNGGPCRGRTYGPLIKSESQEIAQVVETWAIPATKARLSISTTCSYLFHFSLTSAQSTVIANTYITPEARASFG